MSRFKMETSPLVKNSFKGKRNEREKIPFNGFPDSRYPITGGPIATYDMNGVLQPGYADKPSIEGCRYATTVAEGAALGPELSAPEESGEDAENYIESLGNNRYRFVGDGNTATRLRWTVGVGKRYQIAMSDVVAISGSLKCTDATDSDVFADKFSNFTVERTISGDEFLDIFRNTPAQTIDITATFSVREVIPQWVPNIGPELVTNGGFDTDSDWTKGTGWTIADGVLNANSPAQYSYTLQVLNTVVGRNYLVTVDVPSFTSGGLRLYQHSEGYLSSSQTITAAGTYNFQFTAASSSDVLRVYALTAGLVCTVDNISVREVPANYAPWKEKLERQNNPTWLLGANIVQDGTLFTAAAYGGSPSNRVSLSDYSFKRKITIQLLTNSTLQHYENGAYATIATLAGTYQLTEEANVGSLFLLIEENSQAIITVDKVLPDYTTDDTTSLFPYELVRGQKQYTDYEYKYFDARTNLLRYSQDFDNEAWTKINSTIASNVITALMARLPQTHLSRTMV